MEKTMEDGAKKTTENALQDAAESKPKRPRKRRWPVVLLLLALLLLIAAAALHPRGIETYLVVGMDNYGSLNETGRSDVMLLAQLDFSRGRVYAATFARDMLVEGDNGRDVKINTIVRNKDEDALCEAIERNFGVSIDGWFRVNFTTVIELVDALGGAEVELSAEEARYIDRTAGVYPDSPLSEGVSRLNGAQALVYARCRHLDNDFGRGARQSKLVEGLVRQTKSLSISRIAKVFDSLKHAWRSSLDASEQVALLARAIWLRGAQVERIGVPFEGTYRYGSNSNVVADIEKNREMLLAALDRTPAPAAGDE